MNYAVDPTATDPGSIVGGAVNALLSFIVNNPVAAVIFIVIIAIIFKVRNS